MPRTGGVYSPPAGTKGVPNTTIQSVPYNTLIDDLTADANAPRPVTAGGTGATTASGARLALGTDDAANLTTGTLPAARLAGGNYTVSSLSSDGSLFANGGRFIGDDVNKFCIIAPGQTGNYGGTISLRPDGESDTSGELLVTTTGTSWNGNAIWHAGNDSTLVKNNGATYAISISGNAATATTATSATSATSAGDASTLGGQNSAFYRNAGNLNAGTLPAGRLSGTYLATAWNIEAAIGGTSGLRKGNGDGATTITYNVAIDTWYGLALACTFDGIVRHVFNTRNGDLFMTGNLVLGSAIYQQNGDVWMPWASAYLGAVLTSKAGFSTSTDVNETSFPVGQIVMAAGALNRRATSGVWLSSGSSQLYTTSASGAQLSGTWVACGLPSGSNTAMQKIG